MAADGVRLDVVVANAGGGELGHLGEITEEHIERVFGPNVRGVVSTRVVGLLTN